MNRLRRKGNVLSIHVSYIRPAPAPTRKGTALLFCFMETAKNCSLRASVDTLRGPCLKKSGKAPSECKGRRTLMGFCPKVLETLKKLNGKCQLQDSSSVGDGCLRRRQAIPRLAATSLVPIGTAVDIPKREGWGISASLPHGAARIVGGGDRFDLKYILSGRTERRSKI